MAYFDSMKQHKKRNPKSIATGSHDVVRDTPHEKALGNVLKGKNIEGRKEGTHKIHPKDKKGYKTKAEARDAIWHDPRYS